MANVFSILFPINICNAPMDLGNKRNVLKKKHARLKLQTDQGPVSRKAGKLFGPLKP